MKRSLHWLSHLKRLTRKMAGLDTGAPTRCKSVLAALEGAYIRGDLYATGEWSPDAWHQDRATSRAGGR